MATTDRLVATLPRPPPPLHPPARSPAVVVVILVAATASKLPSRSGLRAAGGAEGEAPCPSAARGVAGGRRSRISRRRRNRPASTRVDPSSGRHIWRCSPPPPTAPAPRSSDAAAGDLRRAAAAGADGRRARADLGSSSRGSRRPARWTEALGLRRMFAGRRWSDGRARFALDPRAQAPSARGDALAALRASDAARAAMLALWPARAAAPVRPPSPRPAGFARVLAEGRRCGGRGAGNAGCLQQRPSPTGALAHDSSRAQRSAATVFATPSMDGVRYRTRSRTVAAVFACQQRRIHGAWTDPAARVPRRRDGCGDPGWLLDDAAWEAGRAFVAARITVWSLLLNRPPARATPPPVTARPVRRPPPQRRRASRRRAGRRSRYVACCSRAVGERPAARPRDGYGPTRRRAQIWRAAAADSYHLDLCGWTRANGAPSAEGSSPHEVAQPIHRSRSSACSVTEARASRVGRSYGSEDLRRAVAAPRRRAPRG